MATEKSSRGARGAGQSGREREQEKMSSSSAGGRSGASGSDRGAAAREKGREEPQKKGGAETSEKARAGEEAKRGEAEQVYDRSQVVETLNTLLVVDFDALGLYERVLQNIDNEELRSTIETFRADHDRHIADLTRAIREQSGEPSSRPSVMGPIAKIMASIATTLMGNKGALQALWQGEQYTVNMYENAATGGFPPALRDLVARNTDDERRHLKWVQDTLGGM